MLGIVSPDKDDFALSISITAMFVFFKPLLWFKAINMSFAHSTLFTEST